jgi:short subunit dehydrogenase-like uncharacterized protein
MSNKRRHDVVVYGATGYTGRLVCEYLRDRDPGCRWAIAGRNQAKLDAVHTELGLGYGVAVVVVAACAAHGTDYVDLAGETPWMKEMIEAHHEAAVASGARIVFAGGFDSVPSDLGVHLVGETAIERHGSPMPRVRMRVRSLRGFGSGGNGSRRRTSAGGRVRS